ncbi:hypothetical protein PAXRUDRAFT_20895 [Paxillus rubicundulus Ve08.2h10]|uniref:Uncharacterized protein n=1 Tax=Paxillus rubicundulus Ve08.2h10 TaxID=930991 RepID=A0A0D0CRI4_9AGAM|nr:hypothetical protein PAXRUDRAFT_20895 [Paxillus rubicundulus Ve08.2h10]
MSFNKVATKETSIVKELQQCCSVPNESPASDKNQGEKFVTCHTSPRTYKLSMTRCHT